MDARWIVPVSALLTAGCTTVSLGRLDQCTYRHTEHLGNSHDEVIFCDQDAPHWSEDRAVRIAQECLRDEYALRRDQLIAAQLTGHTPPMPSADPMFSQCIPESLRVMSSENEQLKTRLTGLDESRAQLEKRLAETRSVAESELRQARGDSEKQLREERSESDKRLTAERTDAEKRMDDAQARFERHIDEALLRLTTQQGRLQDGLTDGLNGLVRGFGTGLSGLSGGYVSVASGLTGTLAKALDRPVNAYADAHSSSDSGSESRHQSGTTPADLQASVSPEPRSSPETRSSPDMRVSPDTRVNVTIGAQPHATATPSGARVKKAAVCQPAASPAAGPSLAVEGTPLPKN